MLVLGIDPGTATTGYGLVRETAQGLEAVDYGVILTTPDQTAENRLLKLFEQLNKIILLHRPDSGAVEKLFFQRNVTTAMAVSQARGVVMLAFAQHQLSMREYTPLEVKQAVCGYGAASKGQVQQMVRVLLNLQQIPKPDDAADALAIAICHFQNAQWNAIVLGGA